MLTPVNQFHTNQFDAKPPAVEFEPWNGEIVFTIPLTSDADILG